MTIQHHTIVAIDDTPSIRTFLRIALTDHGADFHEAANAAEGVALCKEAKPDLVVLDLGLPDKDGLDILPAIKEAHPDHPPIVIVLTVRKEYIMRDAAFAQGADAYMTKPFMMEDLLEVIEDALPPHTPKDAP